MVPVRIPGDYTCKAPATTNFQEGDYVVVQAISCAGLFATPWTAARQASSILHCLSEFAQIRGH